MKKIYYNKLVRDKIPAKITRNGGEYKMRKLGKKEFELELLKKVGEEATGLLSAKNKKELASELADIIAVIDEIKRMKPISAKEISKALKENFARKGGFKKKLFLAWASDTGYKTNERRYERK